MPRTEVYQLRLTSQEKAELAARAQSEGGSIAALIRRRCGLSAPPPASAPTAQPIEGQVGAVLDQGYVRKVTDQDIDQLVTRLKGQGYTGPVARRMAKEQLGL